jgi:hypothetical protein
MNHESTEGSREARERERKEISSALLSFALPATAAAQNATSRIALFNP